MTAIRICKNTDGPCDQNCYITCKRKTMTNPNTPAEPAQPVAWLWRHVFNASGKEVGRGLSESRVAPTNNAFYEAPETSISTVVTPLYAHPAPAAPADDLSKRLQLKCYEWNTYWRAPDAHGVVLTQEQAIELLRDALGVEVDITAAPAITQLAEPANAKPR